MSDHDPLSESLSRLARFLLAECERAGGRLVRLRVDEANGLCFEPAVLDVPAGPLSEDWRQALPARERWTLILGEGEDATVLHSSSGARVDEAFSGHARLRVELTRPADFQSPDVLLALRSVASERPSIRFRIELPAGTRDIMRARAGLDSRRPRERR